MMIEQDPKWYKKVVGNDFDKLLAPAKDKDGKYSFNKNSYTDYDKMVNGNGYIEEYWSNERCYSGLINTPGISLLPVYIMGPAYFMFLIYLFLGISISADIFMEAIEVITSTTSVQEFYDSKSKQKV